MADYKKDRPVRDEFPMEEFIIPQVGTSPVTGVQGTVNWGAINKPDQRSRWVIGDGDFDDLVNILPQGVQLQQVPYRGSNFPTPLAASVIWMQATYLNGADVLLALCSNGHIYQISTGGAIIDINPSGGFSTNPICDFTNWQNTTIIICDPIAQKIYSWNGTTFATVFSSQPATNVEVFQNRLWMGNGLTVTWTNINTFNSLSGDAGSIAIIDNDAQGPIIQMTSFFGNLYLFGGNWIKTISGLQDVGSPAVLNFTLTSITNQIGVATHWSVIPFGNILYFANAYGVWQLAGSAPTKVSFAIDGFFQNLVLASSTFSAAYAVIYGTPCLLWQINYSGDLYMPAGTCLIGLTFSNNQPSQWFRVQQGTIAWITGTAASAFSNNLPLAWATDGTNIFQLFTVLTTTFTAYLNTKLWDVTGSKLDYKKFELLCISAVLGALTTLKVSFLNESNQIIQTLMYNASPNLGQWINAAGVLGNWYNAALTQGQWLGIAIAGYFPFQFKLGWRRRGLGLNIQITSAQAVFQSFVIGFARERASRGP